MNLDHPDEDQELRYFYEGNPHFVHVVEARKPMAELTNRQMINFLRDAIWHAKRVAIEPHQKLNRMERVSQFVTSIHTYVRDGSEVSHRSLSMPNPYLYWRKKLCQKEIWHDIGELERSTLGKISQEEREQLITWLDAMTSSTQNDYEKIKMEMREASQSIHQMGDKISNMKILEGQSERLMQRFDKFFGPVSA